jgi:alpha-galactosidase/6-phospho-beta-glucosidase family protein
VELCFGFFRFGTLAGVPADEVFCSVAGLNHQSCFLEIKWREEDLYHRLRERVKDIDVNLKPDNPHGHADAIEIEMMKMFGYFTNGGGHVATSLPDFEAV